RPLLLQARPCTRAWVLRDYVTALDSRREPPPLDLSRQMPPRETSLRRVEAEGVHVGNDRTRRLHELGHRTPCARRHDDTPRKASRAAAVRPTPKYPRRQKHLMLIRPVAADHVPG